MPSPYELRVTSSFEGSGATQAVGALKNIEEGAKAADEALSKAFDQAWESLSRDLTSKFLPGDQREAVLQAFAGMRDEVKRMFDDSGGDVSVFAQRVAELQRELVEVADAAGMWNPQEDAAKWAANTQAVEANTQQLSISEGKMRSLAGAGVGLAGAMISGQSATTALVGGLSTLGGLAGGPLVAGLVVALGGLVSKLVEAEQKRKELKLEELKRQADEAKEAFKELGESIRNDFGKAIEEQKQQLADFIRDANEARANVTKAYGDKEGRAQEDLDFRLAGLDVEKEGALAKAASPEERKQIEEHFKRLEEDEKRAAKFDSLGRAKEASDQERDMANTYLSGLGESERNLNLHIKAAKQQAIDARNDMTSVGVDSDQERIISEFETLNKKAGGVSEEEQKRLDDLRAKAQESPIEAYLRKAFGGGWFGGRFGPVAVDDWTGEIKELEKKGGLTDEEKKRREQLGLMVDRAREQRDAGELTYGMASRDPNLTDLQRRALEAGTAEIAGSADQEKAARDGLSQIAREKKGAEQRVAEANDKAELLRRRTQTANIRDDATEIRRMREDAESPGGSSEVGAAAKDAADNMKEGSEESANEMRQLSTSINSGFSEINSAIRMAAQAATAAAQAAAAAQASAAEARRMAERAMAKSTVK